MAQWKGAVPRRGPTELPYTVTAPSEHQPCDIFVRLDRLAADRNASKCFAMRSLLRKL